MSDLFNHPILTVRIHAGFNANVFLAGLLALTGQTAGTAQAYMARRFPEVDAIIEFGPRAVNGILGHTLSIRTPHEHVHRTPADILRHYEASTLSDEAKAKAVKVTKYDVKLDAADLQTEVVEVVKAAKKLVDLIGADYIVSVGRGISKDVEGGIKLAHELADVLGGVVGGSRVAIDSGWLTADHQVGQTGKTVHPKVYVALGISGSIQHKAGMSESECIIAVNKNDTAPIFEIADYGICGDLFKVTPMLIEAFKAAKASK